MRLLALTLENVGVYSGAQTVEFSIQPERPVTLIGGKNGTGKTSLLDSIPLVLYGRRARRILNGVAYGEYLHGLIHHGADAASVTLEFDRAESGKTVRYSVTRSWKHDSRKRSDDQLIITTDGERRSDLASSWPEFVEGIMPMTVADLAIFDGEKIAALADPVTSSEVLRTSLFGLLGLDLVDRLRADLRAYRRRVAKAHDSDATSDLGAQLRAAEQALTEAEAQRTEALQAMDAAQSSWSEREAELQDAKDRLARAGGDLYAERETLTRNLVESGVAGDTVEREILQLVAGELPLTLVFDLLKSVAAAADQDDAAASAVELRSQMAIRDRRVAQRLASNLGFGSEVIAQVRALLQTDLDGMEHPAEPGFTPTRSAAEDSRSLLHHRAHELQAEVRRLTESLAQHHGESECLERLLAATPDSDSVAGLVQEVANAEAEIGVADRTVLQAQNTIHETDRRATQARRAVDNLAIEVLNAGAEDLKANRIAREVNNAEEVLAEFADRMVRKHLGRITEAINSSINKLLRKNGLLTGVKIDPSDLSITLLRQSGRPLDARRLSAGERQIMATAVLWGLSQCTGMALPTVIDTPVARLDKSHRTNLVERYFPNASRQVVLLSTDEEIIGEQLERLLPHVGAQYRLEFDEIESRTTVVEGYLDE